MSTESEKAPVSGPEAPPPSADDAEVAESAPPAGTKSNGDNEAKAPAELPKEGAFVPPPPDFGGTAKVKGKKSKKKGPVEIAVRLKQVTKRFGTKTAVDGVSLEIKSGRVYGLIGPNGAGKTTTFSMMAGYLRPTEGDLQMLGFAPTRIDQLKSRVGVLPQDAVLPPTDRVGEFLLHMAKLQGIPSDKAKSMALAVLDEVGGRDFWGLKCGALSHGMAKRVALAQALLGEPEIVLLDEPTAGLDPRNAYEVRELIKQRRGTCTLIVSSHNLHELEEICDSAAVLDRGRVVAQGSIAHLTAASEEVRIKVAPARGAPPAKALPLDELRNLEVTKRVDFHDESSELVVTFERGSVDAETVIGHVLWVLLHHQVRISGVTKGRGLERRVMDLTDVHDDDD